MNQQQLYSVTCKNGHDALIDGSALESAIADDESACHECNAKFDLAEEIELECLICQMIFASASLEEASLFLGEPCTHCARSGFNQPSIYVPGSFSMRKGQYEWARSDKNPDSLLRQDRTDYWEGIIHFCQAEQFASIYRDRKLIAKPVDHFQSPAVCLTEATMRNWSEFLQKYGAFGYVFRKRDIIVQGGGPVAYLSESIIEVQARNGGFSRALQPFVKLLRIPTVTPGKEKCDDLFEREWRVPQDVSFEQATPFGIILGRFGPHIDGWEDLFNAAEEFRELNVSKSSG